MNREQVSHKSIVPLILTIIIFTTWLTTTNAHSKTYDFTVPATDAAYAPDELLIRFEPKSNGQQRDLTEKYKILNSLGGGDIKRSFKIVPGLTLVKLPAGLTVEDALKIFNNKEGIRHAQPNYMVKALSTFPNDDYFPDLWGLHNIGQDHPVMFGGTTHGIEDADIDAPEAWDIHTDANNIIVAVIDTGIDYNHPDLAANMWVNQAELVGDPNFDDDGNGYKDDIYGYGCWATYSCIEDNDYGEGNIHSNPYFVDENDYHLYVYSPCMDTGNNAAVDSGDKDIDGEDRIDGGGDPGAIVDMGADEYL